MVIRNVTSSHAALGALPELPAEPLTGDNTLLLGLQALQASDYQHAMSFVNEALEQGLSNDLLKSEALNVRGTFKYVQPLHLFITF